MRVVCPYCKSVNNVPQKDSYTKANCGKCKESLLDTKPIELTTLNFDEVIVNSDIPVVVDFWAPWCGPCKMMAPNFQKSAMNFPLKALFVKVNTENEQNLGARFGIRSIPTIIVFKNAKEVHRVSGALDESALNRLVAQFI
ncbi:thioredoxin [Sulfurimonas denitrificans DSM 1251]|uniref:Thioredoxin n=1 Tax=Sulfurimonas denitrificans (strain ATCC 33889 / DSM 1251) TaxID=326298 RepID=Q30NQ8_SULDN|nr:thioredoxin TrxC [Sulfurimonas denitrificans]ABB45373.1 thioredoxin [Sulfurimonas denitrificans DSM 1251]MDD3442576.1 thioredoxin TrxC [Sulfurimonas denitrificans]